NHFATYGIDAPCSNAEVITTKNTMLKVVSACESPARSGYVARIIGTAPRNPTHEIKSFSFTEKAEVGRSVRKTLTGLARKIKMIAINNPLVMMGGISVGKTSNPKVKNMVI